MAFSIVDILNAQQELNKFRLSKNNKEHERFIFPFFCGSYFTYRKIDVIRIFTIAKAISKNPTYLDVGCGYGDFLEKIREYLPNAEGMEKSLEIFYSTGRIKPEYITIADAYNGIDKKYDLIFVGWMEPGADYRDKVAKSAKCIITTLDQGGQCGINGGCEFEEYGFKKIAELDNSFMDRCKYRINEYILYKKNKGKRSTRIKKIERCTQSLVCLLYTRIKR